MMKSDWLTVCFILLFLAEKAGFWDFGTNVELIEATFTGLWAALVSLQSHTFL